MLKAVLKSMFTPCIMCIHIISFNKESRTLVIGVIGFRFNGL